MLFRSYLGSGNTPAGVYTSVIDKVRSADAAALITIPMIGYVSADKAGTDVRDTPDYLNVRFHVSHAAKGSGFVFPPDTADDDVYQDEAVHYLFQQYPDLVTSPTKKIFFDLDNEPDLWSSTHEAIHPADADPDELIAKSAAYAAAIKDVIPGAETFGFVSYGFNGLYNLQNAYTGSGTYTAYYLAGMQNASAVYGSRLLDVLDLHWYSEAQAGSTRITDISNATTETQRQAIVQAPRSLWDPTYSESSWITQYVYPEIKLIPRVKAWIAAGYPGTRISISEYNHGGTLCIAGGIAQADTLGIFGREGVYAACFWELTGSEDYLYGGFKVFRNYDGSNSAFGDTGLAAVTDDYAKTSVYASRRGDDNGTMILVAINKENASNTADIQLTNHPVVFGTANVYLLDDSGSDPHFDRTISVAGNNLMFVMPAYSVSVVVLTP